MENPIRRSLQRARGSRFRIPFQGRVGRLSAVALALSFAAVLGLVAFEIGQRRSFESAAAARTDVALASAPGQLTSRTAIAMIGDSWISNGKMTGPVSEALSQRGLSDVAVRSFGQGGAVSRQILRNLVVSDPTEPDAQEFSSRRVLEAGDVRYCVVIAGVNDSAQHLGPDFYAHHVTEIARTLLAHSITPLIVELPEYGIETLYEKRSGLRLAKDVVLSRLFDDGEIDVIAKYRQTLRDSLADAGLTRSVSLIDFDAVAVRFEESRDLYKDPSHLNEAGRARLAEVLADSIASRFARDGRGLPTLQQVASRL